MPDPETLARMVAAIGTIAVGASVVAFVGWIVGLGTILELLFGVAAFLIVFAGVVILTVGR